MMSFAIHHYVSPVTCDNSVVIQLVHFQYFPVFSGNRPVSASPVAKAGLVAKAFQDQKDQHSFLVGGLVAIFYFPRNIGFLIIPIDELLFFRGVGIQPPTSDVLEKFMDTIGYLNGSPVSPVQPVQPNQAPAGRPSRSRGQDDPMIRWIRWLCRLALYYFAIKRWNSINYL